MSQRTERRCDFRFQGENGADLWPGSFQLPRGSRLFLDSRESLYDESVQLALFSKGGISTTAVKSMILSMSILRGLVMGQSASKARRQDNQTKHTILYSTH